MTSDPMEQKAREWLKDDPAHLGRAEHPWTIREITALLRSVAAEERKAALKDCDAEEAAAFDAMGADTDENAAVHFGCTGAARRIAAAIRARAKEGERRRVEKEVSNP